MNKNTSMNYDTLLNSTISTDWFKTDLVLNDFICTLENSIDEDMAEKANITSLHVVGPLSFKVALDYSQIDRELFVFADLGSFSLTCNRFLVDYLNNAYKVLRNYFGQVYSFYLSLFTVIKTISLLVQDI